MKHGQPYQMILRPGRGQRLRDGYQWVFERDIQSLSGEPGPKDGVAVLDSNRRYLGSGFYNPESRIRLRLFSRNRLEPLDEGMLERRIEAALRYREAVLDQTGLCRLVYSEADQLPGLIVDRFGPVLVIQTLTRAMAAWQETLVAILRAQTSVTCVYQRNDVAVRRLEGLERVAGIVWGELPDNLSVEHGGLRLPLDVEEGQKTGLFLDQRANHLALRPYVKGRRVLDAFCNAGGFALHAAAAGAREVVAMDNSGPALDLGRRAAELNGLQDKVAWREENVFDYLRQETEPYDLIILDPPAFAPNRRSLGKAYRGYKEINLRALRGLTPGGLLLTCSCSYHMSPSHFRSMVVEAARDARRILRLVAQLPQAADHPVLPAHPESEYLKCLLLEVQ